MRKMQRGHITTDYTAQYIPLHPVHPSRYCAEYDRCHWCDVFVLFSFKSSHSVSSYIYRRPALFHQPPLFSRKDCICSPFLLSFPQHCPKSTCFCSNLCFCALHLLCFLSSCLTPSAVLSEDKLWWQGKCSSYTPACLDANLSWEWQNLKSKAMFLYISMLLHCVFYTHGNFEPVVWAHWSSPRTRSSTCPTLVIYFTLISRHYLWV